jgi:hypothetical protein
MTKRGDSSAAERAVGRPHREVGSDESASPLHTQGRIVAAPMPYGCLWGLYDARGACFGAIGEPSGHDSDVVAANARRLTRAWNNFDDVLALLGALAGDVGGIADLRERARQLYIRLGGLQ